MAVKNSVACVGHTVTDDIAAVEAMASRGLDVHSERCVRLRNRHATCRRCVDACTSGAITLQEGRRVFHPERCVGCGTCATMCPTCALEARHPSDAVLLRAARSCAENNDGTAFFRCGRVSEDGRPDAVEVSCLSRLDESLLFSLLASGVRAIRGWCGDCEGCPRETGVNSIRTVEETVRRLGRAWGIEPDYAVTRFEGAPQDGCASDAKPGGTQSVGAQPCESAEDNMQDAVRKPQHVQKDGTLPHFVPMRRHKLLDALQTLGEPVQENLNTRLWGHVSIDETKCMACKMCAVFCPTGALSRYSDEDGDGIEHYLAECVHCCLCRDICPAKAIRCDTEVSCRQLACHETERHPMDAPAWSAGPDQILQRMRVHIGGQSVEHSY